ncbi:MAG: hypothetical protein HY921_09050 [Elusimicrobia bacterium]|nr:hypothetical protein [Elusimicrobiota bacterium]
MEYYLRFVITLSIGLVGLGLVLKVLLDELFSDWDLFGELGDWLRGTYQGRGLAHVERTEDVMLEIEKSKVIPLSTRMIEKRREQLEEIAAVERNLKVR